MIIRLSIFLFLFTSIIVSIACKEAILGPEFPVTDFSKYDCIAVVTIDHAEHEDQGYRPLKTFQATIKKCLKGELASGAKIEGIANVEEPRAVCPVHLDENSEYLVLLTKTEGTFGLSRFSFPIKKGFRYFDQYILQIEKRLSK